MARIVLASFGSYGDLNPYVGLARALRAHGHQPVLATQAHFRPVVERAGLELRPIRPDLDPNDPLWARRVMDPRRGAEVLIRELLLPHLRASYDDLAAAARDADLLVTHPITFAGPLVAATTGVRWASSVLAPLSLGSARDPSLTVPSPAVAWLFERQPWAYQRIYAVGRAIARRWTAPVARLRAELGLPPGAHPVFEGQHAPSLVLALFPRVLAEPQPDWPANTVVTGAIVDDVAYGDALPPALARFLDEGPPPVVFTLGSSAVGAAGAARFYRESAAAVQQLGVRAVLLVGRDAANVPANLSAGVLALPSAPHSALLPRAAAVVHQGGAGTLAQALRAGVPMLVVPHAHDQPDNALRAARLGVARVLWPSRYTAARAAAALGPLLDDPAVRARAERVGTEVRAEPGARGAVAAIEGLLGA